MPSTNRNRQARKNRPAVGNESVPTGNATPKSMVPLYTGHEPTPGLERVGDILRRRRQQRGDELQPIADYLCIRKSFLVALENSDYDALPADAYVVGFLRSYAAYLGFDGTEAVNRYRGEMSGRRRKPALVLPTPIAEGRTPSALVMIGAAIVAVAIYVIWYSFSTSDRALVTAPPSLSAAPAAGAEGAPAMPIPGGIALSSPPPNELSSSTSGGPGQTVFSPAPGAPSIANTQAAVKPMHAEAPVAPEKTKPAAEKNPPAEKPAADKTAGTAVKGDAAAAEETPPAASRLAIRAV
ncbi:MAG: helix-turn-helix domain-containing protein [Bdellovibrionales bacterium]